MRVFIYSNQFEIAELLAENLSDSNTFCIPFQKISHIQDTIKNSKTLPDLIILDYLTFNHEAFNITSHIIQHGIRVPIIYYNEPCLVKKNRAGHWKTMLTTLSGETRPENPDMFDPIFIKLQNFIESDEISPYIALMAKPKQLPEKYLKNTEAVKFLRGCNTGYIYEFKQRSNLSNCLFYLLSILHKYKETGITLEEIVEVYRDDGRTVTVNSLKVFISKLKAAIRKDGHCNFLIDTSNKTVRFVVYRI